MNTLDPAETLAGKLLVAMPGMGDPRFEKGVVYICAHGDDGAMGLMVNKPATPQSELTFGSLLEQLSIPRTAEVPQRPVYFGGPVETGRGFVLHSADYDSNPATLKVDDGFGMTATLDILQEMAAGGGPRQALLALGYAGWGAGQIEAELAQNAWLTAAPTAEIVFDTPDAQKWSAAIKSLGVDPLMLSASGGRA